MMLGGAGLLLATSPAQAADTSYKTECIPPAVSGLPPVEGTTVVQLTAPAEAKVGDTVEVVWKTVEAASKNPDMLDLDKDTVKPTGTIKVGGAATGTLQMEGPRQNPPIPKNSAMVLPDMKGTLKLEKAGEITLTPDAYNINVSKPISTDTKCSPKETVKTGATIKVTDGGGATTGGGTTSGSTAAGGTTSGSTTGSTTAGGTTSGSTAGGTTSGSTTSGSTTAGGTTSGSGGGRTDFPGKEVAVHFTCTSPGPADISSKVTINAKKSGGSYALTVKTAKGVMDSPAALPAGALKPSMDVVIAGADKGSVKVTGPANAEPLEQGKPVDLSDMTGTYKPGASGKSTLSPGTLTIDVTLGASKINIPCKVKGSVTPSLELDTTAQQGGASGSTTSGSTGTAGSSAGGTDSGGGLAATGAEGTGTLHALGLVAGTAILLGGAVFTFTPWRRLRGTR
ncbi:MULTISPECIES: hypothetical protein [unclassified Streptomyces]|uniref:hypothetical protein n=1 Tax=unclassified Streptomyces TaxID=2593676 RepID=UPI002251D691|nr:MULTISPECIES: hypothetical protein [unclassified Streptomyces]WSU26565.1 hypothetical protein OG508_24640 [Streptomyces sp. NBC_01108]MCX4787148.1 hypothetical protein [Streptomyces sp. NBC_01221]MCX4797069.1 hypothetical protein [Streptomyces sp. NBC_01242]WSJ41152.1 hypothetical protein OG772_21750 [Streptomyces sp. NBC_01321]WSP67485.1 hypothetical protein OG466_24375 [Streptomyces sp. NBC_01240]